MSPAARTASGVSWKLLAYPLLVFFLFLALGCGGSDEQAGLEERQQQEEQLEVPPEYRGLYAELASKLEEIDAYVDGKWGGEKHGTVFSVELVNANGNRGEILLEKQTLAAVETTLSSLKDLGVRGVTLSVQYPMLNTDFPRSDEYLAFYRKVAARARSLGFTLIVETTTVFPNPEISPLGVDYSGLTLQQYIHEKRVMVEKVLRELAPDFLTIENEPMTQRANTGLDFSVANQTTIVNGILSGLERAGTKIGAGAGSWDDLAYFESLAANTQLDYLDIHFYPIQGDLIIDRAERISEIARSAGKGLAVSETWLYKASASELRGNGTPATAAGIFARDAYSFWAPLDQAFLEAMVKLSHYLELEFLSPFWMQYFYAYLDCDDVTREMGYGQIQKMSCTKAWPNIQAGSLSPTGERYKRLIAGESDPEP